MRRFTKINEGFNSKNFNTFVKLGMEFGNKMTAEDDAGNGVDKEEFAKEFLEYFEGELEKLNKSFNRLKDDLNKEYPNLNK